MAGARQADGTGPERPTRRLAVVMHADVAGYSKLMGDLRRKNVALNRKMLSEIAIADPAGFDALVALAEGGYAVEVDAGDGTTRLVAVQRWPELPVAPATAMVAAFSRSASSRSFRMISGSLPPSSSAVRL